MTDLRFMPIYWGDFLADTSHLNGVQSGSYLLLLGQMWLRGGWVPDDDEQLARMCRLEMDEWHRVRPFIRPFLIRRRGRFSQKRLLSVYKTAHATHQKNRAITTKMRHAKATKNQRDTVTKEDIARARSENGHTSTNVDVSEKRAIARQAREGAPKKPPRKNPMIDEIDRRMADRQEDNDGYLLLPQRATTDQKLATLRVMLSSLPKPSPDDAGAAVSAYLVALDGVSEAALQQSLMWALQGRHGSLFVPWPTELRKLCDEAEQPFLDELARLKRQERIAAEKLPPQLERSPEEIARQQERMRRFYDMHDRAKTDIAKQFPKLAPPRKFEPQSRSAVNPPDWLDGEELYVTPRLLEVLTQQQEERKTP